MIQLLGSATTLRACAELNRNCYGFEIKKNFYSKAMQEMISEDLLKGILRNGQISFESLNK